MGYPQIPLSNPMSFWRPVSDRMLDRVNVLDYLPYRLVHDIRAGQCDADLSNWLVDASRAGGPGSEVWFPPGRYYASMIPTFADQMIRGSGRGTIMVRNTADPVFVPDDWLRNNTHIKRGPVIRDMAISNGATSPGGFAILNLSYDDRFERLTLDGLGICLTARTQSGAFANHGQTGNHRFGDLTVRNSPDGAIYNAAVDKVTDCPDDGFVWNNCGSATRAALETATLSGWTIIRGAAFLCPGTIIRSGKTQNVLVSSCNLDFDCTDPQDGGNVAIEIESNGVGVISITGNALRIDGTDPEKSYTMVSLKGGDVTVPLAHVGNGYSVKTSISGSNVVAAACDAPMSGARGPNGYNGFTGEQIGNVEP